MGRKINTVEKMLTRQVDVTDSCWVWTGNLAKNGYGKAAINRKTRTAHRVFYEHFIGPIPKGLEIDHLCRNRECVNPAHLEAVTHKENVRRGEAKPPVNPPKVVCLRGHALAGENLYHTPDGRRQCKKCRCASVILHQKKKVVRAS